MIRVLRYQPPVHYQSKVREPGLRYLSRHPQPTSTQFAKHAYWKEAHDDLYQLYSGICAYCASWSPRVSNPQDRHTSVDHFIPKTIQPAMAYEWENFRLCRSRLNSKKDNSLDVMDPFYIQDGWFTIDFSTFLLKPASSAPLPAYDRILVTIRILGLNTNDYVYERIEVIRHYCRGHLTLEQLRKKWPFIAAEIIRQNFDLNYGPRMRAYFAIKP